MDPAPGSKPPAAFSIVQAGRQHAAQIGAMVAALVAEISGKQINCNNQQTRAFLDEAMQSGNYTVFLAIDADGQAVGLISLGACGAVYAGGRFGVIHELYVDPGMRSRGIGAALLERAKQTSVQRRWGRLEVGAPGRPQWSRTSDFYQREGFQLIGPRLRWTPAGPPPD